MAAISPALPWGPQTGLRLRMSFYREAPKAPTRIGATSLDGSAEATLSGNSCFPVDSGWTAATWGVFGWRRKSRLSS